MLSPRWRKVLRDLWGNKSRTILVALSIAVGVFAVGTVTHTFTIVGQELSVSYPKANPASATLSLSGFDETLVESVRRVPGVEYAEGRAMTVVRLRMGENDWKNLLIFAIPDFDDIRINKVVPQGAYEPAADFHAENGTWPPPNHAITLERSSFLIGGLVPSGLRVGDTIDVQMSSGSPVRQLKLAGLAKESVFAPAPFVSFAYGYVTLDTYEWLTGSRKMDQLLITVSENKLDKAHITSVANEVKSKLESGGITVGSVAVSEPGKHPLQDIFSGLLLILNLLGFGALILSGFLVINTITALLAQQVRQIGIMKAIGGRTYQIIALYLVTVLLFGLFSLIIAIPSAMFVAGQLSEFLAGFVNVDFPDFSLPPSILYTEIAIGLMLPLLAALYPILAGTRVTVREAISDYGLGKGQVGLGWTDRLLEKVRGLSRPTILSFRNTFRRKARLALTLITLVLGGTMFISVLNVSASMYQTLDDVLKNWQFDILLPFERPYRTDVVEELARQTPGVTRVESWGYGNVRRLRAGDTESDSITLFAAPPDTTMIEPTVTQGRWLMPEDDNAIVLSQGVFAAEKDLKIGDEITLKIGERKATWRIVGSARVVGMGGGIGVAYVNYPYYARLLGQVGRAASVQLNTARHDTASQLQIKQMLETRYLQIGVSATAGGLTSGEIRDQNAVYFNIISVLLMVMAVLMAMVGGLGLMGTMSLNVLERTREIGVMRAVGASNGAVRGIVLTEGVFIGLLSALISVVLSYPISKAFSDLVGNAIFHLPLSFTVSVEGIVLWMIIVSILSALASLLPAYSASRLTVREILSYE